MLDDKVVAETRDANFARRVTLLVPVHTRTHTHTRTRVRRSYPGDAAAHRFVPFFFTTRVCIHQSLHSTLSRASHHQVSDRTQHVLLSRANTRVSTDDDPCLDHRWVPYLDAGACVDDDLLVPAFIIFFFFCPKVPFVRCEKVRQSEKGMTRVTMRYTMTMMMGYEPALRYPARRRRRRRRRRSSPPTHGPLHTTHTHATLAAAGCDDDVVASESFGREKALNIG